MINNKQKLQDAISYQFIEDKFLTRALTHKSYDKKNIIIMIVTLTHQSQNK